MLAECRGFIGTLTSNFGLLVTKLMAFHTLTPLALDISCAGLSSMLGIEADAPVWRLEWDDERDAKRCRRFGRHEEVKKKKQRGDADDNRQKRPRTRTRE